MQERAAKGISAFDVKLAQKSELTVNIVGDSVTNGLNHCTPEETYTAFFAGMLAKRCPEYSVYRYDGVYPSELGPMDHFDGPITVQTGTAGVIDVIKNGIGGNTVRRAHNRIADFTGILANGKTADITTMMFGINDALKPDPAKYVTPEVYKQQYLELISDIRRIDPQTMIILLTPTTNGPLHEYCQIIMEIAKEEDLYLIDQNHLWYDHYQEGAPNFGHGDWLSNTPGDACHPTPLGAEKIAEYMYRCIFDEYPLNPLIFKGKQGIIVSMDQAGEGGEAQ